MPFIYVGDHDCDLPDPHRAGLGLWALWTCEECGTIWKLNPRDEWRRPVQWLARRDLRQRHEADRRREALVDDLNPPRPGPGDEGGPDSVFIRRLSPRRPVRPEPRPPSGPNAP